MASLTKPSIAVVLCSTRKPRVCPQIGDFVMQTIQTHMASSTTAASTSAPIAELTLLDLTAWNLPIFDEPAIPSEIHNHLDYVHPHTRAWSLEVQKYSGFIFVTPQYNWGYPAVIKNAIDYLFHEWRGKSAMIVSYGGHGGVKAAAQLRQVLQGVRMNVAETMPALKFPSKLELAKAAKGDDLDLLGEGGIWDSERPSVSKSFEELMALVSPHTEGAGVSV